jgi:hypothetical protein
MAKARIRMVVPPLLRNERIANLLIGGNRTLPPAASTRSTRVRSRAMRKLLKLNRPANDHDARVRRNRQAEMQTA